MSKFQVTTSELNSAVSDLTEKNNRFKTAVNDLVSLQETLSGEWQGDANTAFQQNFNTNKSKWDSFAKLMDQYIQTLQSISQTYDKAEERNVTTARNKRS